MRHLPGIYLSLGDNPVSKSLSDMGISLAHIFSLSVCLHQGDNPESISFYFAIREPSDSLETELPTVVYHVRGIAGPIFTCHVAGMGDILILNSNSWHRSYPTAVRILIFLAAVAGCVGFYAAMMAAALVLAA